MLKKLTAWIKTLLSGTKTFRKNIFIFLALILVASIVGIIILALRFDVSKDSFGRTITDTLLKIISVSFIGTLLSLLLEDYNREQSIIQKRKEERQTLEKNRDQYRKDVLQRLQKLYAKTKNARRMLRAKGFSVPYYGNEDDNKELSLIVYDLSMDDINDSQLELEAIRHEITTEKSVFSNAAGIAENLKIMDDYLGELLKEYEKQRPAFTGDPATLRIRDLPETKTFLKPAYEGEFKTKFSSICNNVRKEIRNDINAMNKIVVYGNSDRSREFGFPTEDDFIRYIKGDIFKLHKGRYQYSQAKAADIIVLSRDGKAYGYFVISGTTKPTADDLELSKTSKNVYLVKESVSFARPVKLLELGITGYQFGKSIAAQQFEDIKRLGGTQSPYTNQ